MFKISVKDKKIISYLNAVSDVMFLNLFLNFLITILLFILGIELSPKYSIAIITISMSIVFWLRYRINNKGDNQIKIPFLMLIIASIIILSFLLMNYIYDFSYDGRAYQQEAVIQLARGWNPLREDIRGINIFNADLYYDYLNCFPKFIWINQALVFSSTGSIEASKLINLIMIIILLLKAIYVIKSSINLKTTISILIAVALCLNPVIWTQVYTFYIDIHVYIMYALTMLLAIRYITTRDRKDKYLFIIGIIVACNIKFTLVGYLGISLVLLTLWDLIVHKKLELIKIGIISCSLQLVIGAHPYITNLIYKGSMLYPFVGELSKNLTSGDLPQNFMNMNRFERLGYSIFSHPQIHNTGIVELKNPLSITMKDFHAFIVPDVRMAGFGPLFAIMICISLLIMGVALLNRDKNIKMLLIAQLILMIPVFITKDGWWARYAPQVWLIPIIMLVYIAIKVNTKKEILNYFFFSLLTLIIIVNSTIIIYINTTQQLKDTYALNNQLEQISSEEEVDINFGVFPSNRLKFDKYGITYNEISKEQEEFSNILLGGGTTFEVSNYEVGEEILFGLHGNSKKFLRDGWMVPEEGFNWTTGQVGRLEIKINNSNILDKGGELILKYHTLVTNDELSKQKVNFIVNGELIDSWTLEGGGIYERKISIPEGLILDDQSIKIDIGTPKCISPAELSLNGDTRKHGIAVHSIRIEKRK